MSSIPLESALGSVSDGKFKNSHPPGQALKIREIQEPKKNPGMEESANVKKKAEETVDTEQLKAAVTHINSFVQSIQRELQFSIDEESGDTIVKVIDKSTNEVVRQIPAEELMETLKNMNKPGGSGLILESDI